MTLAGLLLIIAVTAMVCGLTGLSSPLAILVTILVAASAIVLAEAFFPNPWRPIEKLERRFSSDNDLFIQAKRRAIDSLPLFWSLCADGGSLDAKVRVHLNNRNGENEDLWMFLLELPDAEGRIRVHLSTMPRLGDYDFMDAGDIDFHVHKNQIVDWSIEQSNGTIRGAFTTFALFEFFEQSVGPLPKRTKALRERFVDAVDH
jgi:hypothetical protein